MIVSAQWRDTHILLEDFMEELENNSYNRMETSFKFRDRFLEMKDTHDSILDRELVELFDFLRFNLLGCEDIFMSIALLSQAAIVAELKTMN